MLPLFWKRILSHTLEILVSDFSVSCYFSNSKEFYFAFRVFKNCRFRSLGTPLTFRISEPSLLSGSSKLSQSFGFLKTLRFRNLGYLLPQISGNLLFSGSQRILSAFLVPGNSLLPVLLKLSQPSGLLETGCSRILGSSLNFPVS